MKWRSAVIIKHLTHFLQIVADWLKLGKDTHAETRRRLSELLISLRFARDRICRMRSQSNVEESCHPD